MWGWKPRAILDSEDCKEAEPLTKRVQASSLGQAGEAEEQRQWWEHVMDMLKVAKVEQQAACMQRAVMIQAMEYISKAVYHQYVVGRRGSGKEWEGTVVPERKEMQEAGVMTSAEASEEVVEAPKGGPED